jgi:tetratricopeptide (TPR) repeat protein
MKTMLRIMLPSHKPGSAGVSPASRKRTEGTRRRDASAPREDASIQGYKPRNFVLFLLAVVAWIFTGSAMAADFSTAFNSANKLYAEGRFAEAAAGYGKILQASQVSPALYFNQGNAEFKSGNLGRAIAAYRRAARLAPRDAEVRANLEFARDQVTGPTRRESRWSNWLGMLTLNEWTALTMVAFWLMFALLAARQLRPALKPALRGLTLGAVIATLLAGAGLGAAAARHFSRQTAVIVAPDVTARSGPFDEAQSAFTANNGAELAVLDQRDDWLQVTDGSGRIGWLPRKQLEILPGS